MDSKQLQNRKNEVIAAQEKLVKAAMDAKAWSDAQETEYTNLSNELKTIDTTFARFEAVAASKKAQNAAATDAFVPNTDGKEGQPAVHTTKPYNTAFWNYIRTRDTRIINAALGETVGAPDTDGSYLVPSMTDPTIPALAVIEASARKLSVVIPTEMDIKLPYQASKTVAAAKAESNNSGTHAFATNVPTFNTTTLSAYNAGDSVAVSWELLQDVGALAAFVTADLNRAVFNYEEDKFINGSGDGEPLGYLSGISTPRSASLSIDSVLDLTGDLRQAYYAGAKFLMNRQTLISLQKAQVAADQFQTFITWNKDGSANLLGYEVNFSSQMPVYSASPAVDGAILFGDFAAGWVIGDRGDSAIRAKVLDQVAALSGQTIVLGYRRTDQRCRIQEAVKGLTITG